MKNTKKRILSALLAAVMAAAALPVTAMAESLSETAISAEYAAALLSAPQNVSATEDYPSFLTWGKVKDADGYRVYIYNEESEEFEKYRDVTKTECEIDSMVPGEAKRFRVAALVKKDGKYLVQEKSKSITIECEKLSAPKNLKSTKTKTSVTLTWDEVSGADSYRVFQYNSKTEKYEKLKDVKKTECEIDGLSSGTKYRFRVAALVKSEDGTYVVQKKSDSKTVTTKSSSSSSSKESSKTSKIETGAGGYPVFNPPMYGDTKSDVFKMVGKENLKKGSTGSVGTTYSGYCSFGGEVARMHFTFDKKDRVAGWGLAILDSTSDDFYEMVDLWSEKFGNPTSSDVFERYWNISNEVIMSISYSLKSESVLLTTLYRYG